MGITVADEYYERYRRLTHAELYRQLGAGSPAQVEELATTWHRAEEELRELATSLRRDLAALASNWTGAGSREYQRRLGLLVTWTEELAEEAVTIRTGLSLMANMLSDAQRKAEPDPGAVPAERAFDGVLGSELGHAVAAAERQRAHDRMARLVADLAASYAVANHQHWPAALTDAPWGLPGTAAVEEHRSRHGHGPHGVHWRFGGTQLAGHFGHHLGVRPEPVHLQHHHHQPVTSAAPAVHHDSTPAPAPAAHLRGASTVHKTGSGLAASAATSASAASHLDGSPGHATGAESASSTGSAPMPMMGAASPSTGYSTMPPDGTVGGYHRPFETDTSWLAGGNQPWVDGVDDAPPGVLGGST